MRVSDLVVRPFLLAFFIVSIVSAAARAEERILLPIAVDVSGANGSFFETLLTIRYVGTERFVTVRGAATYGACIVLCPQETTFLPNRTQNNFMLDGKPGLWLSTDDGVVSDLRFNLRVRDRTRNADSAGTEIPVVRESQFTSTPVELLNVPVGTRFRTMLRIYSLDGEANARVRIAYEEGNEDVVREVIVPVPKDDVPEMWPSYGELSGVTSGASALARSVRVQVTSDSGQRLWAFVSITNNETQQITLVTPE